MIFVPVRLLGPEVPVMPDLKLLFTVVEMSCSVLEDSLLAPVLLAPFDLPREMGVFERA